MEKTQTTIEFSRADYLNEKCTHAQYYGQFAHAGIKAAVLGKFGKDKLTKAFEGDPHLNTIPLAQWDGLAPVVGSYGTRLKEAGDYLTFAGSVCILKEAARQIVAES